MRHTLVGETSGFRDGGRLDVNGSPLTDAAKMTERFTGVNYGTRYRSHRRRPRSVLAWIALYAADR